MRPLEVKGTLLFMIDKLMSGSSFVGKAFIKPQNSELEGFTSGQFAAQNPHL